MTFWTTTSFAQVTGGRWLHDAPSPTLSLHGVSTDSRSVDDGAVFIALPGERFDAHDFLTQACDAGAAMLIVSHKAKALAARNANSPPMLLVPDTLAALQQLARAYRTVLAEAGVKVIAVGGSNGKTTTRHLIHCVLSANLSGTQSPKSFNNHIGVPLTLLGARESDQFVVAEVGTNHPGEIDGLASILQPDAAVITSIGREHMAYFKTLGGVAAEEAALLRHVQSGGLILTPRDHAQANLLQPHLATLPAEIEQQAFGFVALKDAAIRPTAAGYAFTDDTGRTFDVPLLGRHNVNNAAAAIAVGRWMGMTDDAIASGLSRATGMPMRMQLVVMHAGPPTTAVINDAYNANPDSMQAAINQWLDYPLKGSGHRRRVAVLGDMLELGDAGPDEHRAVGQLLVDRLAARQESHQPRIILVGRLAMFIAETLSRDGGTAAQLDFFPAWNDALPEQIAALIEPGDLILLKASRGMGLERLIPAMQHAIPVPEST